MVYLISSLLGLFIGSQYENFLLLLPVLAMVAYYLRSYTDGQTRQKALGCFLLFALFFVRVSLADTTCLEAYQGTSQAKVLASEKKENSYQLFLRLGDKKSLKILFYSKKNIPAGSQAIFQGHVQSREEASDWSTESYPLYLKSRRIQGQGHGSLVRVLKPENFLYQAQEKTSQKLRDNELNPRAKEPLQEAPSSKEGGNFWSDQLKDLGPAHIPAISGLRIGLLYGNVKKVLMSFPPRRRALGLAYLPAILYPLFIGGPIGGFRVLFLLLFSLIEERGVIKFDYLKLLVLAVCLQLLISPLHLYSMGFYLSYGIYFSLIFIKLYLDRAFHLFNGGFLQLIMTSIAINLGIFPFSLAMQFEINLAQILANILLLPLYGLFINVGFLYGLGQLLGIDPYLFSPLLSSLSDLLLLGNQILMVSSKIKPRFGKANLEAQILFYLVVYLAYFGSKLRGRPRKFFSSCCLIFSLGPLLTGFSQAREEGIYFIYVGQGSSSLIRSKNKIYLVGTGGAKKSRPAREYLVPSLKARGVKQIDHIIISHWDEDHCSGLRDLAKDLKIEQVHFSHIYLAWTEFLERENIPASYVETGYEYSLDQDPSLDVSAGDNLEDKENNRSLVLYAQLENQRILFTGDGEEELEERLKPYPTNVYQVGHHGSKTSSGEKFSSQIKPRITVVLSGENNSFGHPHQEVLDRLKSHGMVTHSLKDKGCLFYNVKTKEMTQTGQERGLNTYEVLVYLLVLNGYMCGLRKVFKDHELLAN